MDIRTRQTRDYIKKGTLELLDKYDFQNINVSLICEKCDINRATFYNHYSSLDNLYQDIENDLFEVVDNKVNQYKSYELSYDLVKDILSLIYDNHHLAMMILTNFNKDSILDRLFNQFQRKYIVDYKEKYPNIKEDKISSFFTYLFGGSKELILSWLKNGMKDDKEIIAGRFIELNGLLIKSFIKFNAM